MVVAQYLLSFREVLEAALLSAIILAFLVKSGRQAMVRYAWYGILAAVGVSIALGAVIWSAFGVLSEASQKLFEGIAALVAVSVLTSMIFWMALKGRLLKSAIERRVESVVTQGAIMGLAVVTFILVFREGLETVLFLTPFLVSEPASTLVGAVLGVGMGSALAYGIFRMGLKLDLRKFFFLTSILLVLVAGGLLGLGIHELIEYAETQGVGVGWFGSDAYDLGLFGGDLDAGIPPDPWHHKGAIGSVFAVLFGYAAKAEWARVIAHGAYLAIALPLIVIVYRKPEWVARLGRMFQAAKAVRAVPESPR